MGEENQKDIKDNVEVKEETKEKRKRGRPVKYSNGWESVKNRLFQGIL